MLAKLCPTAISANRRLPSSVRPSPALPPRRPPRTPGAYRAPASHPRSERVPGRADSRVRVHGQTASPLPGREVRGCGRCGSADDYGRLARQPAFDGAVRPGADYVIVDDFMGMAGRSKPYAAISNRRGGGFWRGHFDRETLYRRNGSNRNVEELRAETWTRHR